MSHFAYEWYSIALIMFIGFYCMLVSRSIVRQLIGLEIVSKAAMLALVSAGALANNLIYAQVVKTFRLHHSADIWKLDSLKG